MVVRYLQSDKFTFLIQGLLVGGIPQDRIEQLSSKIENLDKNAKNALYFGSQIVEFVKAIIQLSNQLNK